jgi:SAM-dependent methyltransferase
MRHINYETERLFENAKAADRSIRAAQTKYYWAVEPVIGTFKQSVRDAVTGKTVLEIGCARGDDAATYAPAAHRYIGIDLADEAINVARSRNLPNAEFIVCNAHAIPLDTACCDVVVVNAVLHHLDLVSGLAEIKRLMKPGGLLFIIEPLGTNPLFQLYRKLTPKARTADEKPLTESDLDLLATSFGLESMQFAGLAAVASAFARNRKLRALLLHLDSLLERTPARCLFWQLLAVYQAPLDSDPNRVVLSR